MIDKDRPRVDLDYMVVEEVMEYLKERNDAYGDPFKIKKKKKKGKKKKNKD